MSKLFDVKQFIAMHLMTFTKKGISAKKMQRQLGCKCYEPVWFIMQKIRIDVRARDERHELSRFTEMDEVFSTTIESAKGCEKNNHGYKTPGQALDPSSAAEQRGIIPSGFAGIVRLTIFPALRLKKLSLTNKFKRGLGSEKQTPVLVMALTEKVNDPKNHRQNSRSKYF